jgi:hypothetical protein
MYMPSFTYYYFFHILYSRRIKGYTSVLEICYVTSLKLILLSFLI